MNNLDITNCFGYKNNKCVILKEMICKHKKCPFYKTEEQYIADKEKYDVKMR